MLVLLTSRFDLPFLFAKRSISLHFSLRVLRLRSMHSMMVTMTGSEFVAFLISTRLIAAGSKNAWLCIVFAIILKRFRCFVNAFFYNWYAILYWPGL